MLKAIEMELISEEYISSTVPGSIPIGAHYTDPRDPLIVGLMTTASKLQATS